MSKIVTAINVMITNSDKITNVCKNGEEIFFLYRNKYIWSIRASKEYYLYYYPEKYEIAYLSNLGEEQWENIDMVIYTTKDLNTREAVDSFKELYEVVLAKILGIDEVLDDIISEA
jgi:hypothetical protein